MAVSNLFSSVPARRENPAILRYGDRSARLGLSASPQSFLADLQYENELRPILQARSDMASLASLGWRSPFAPASTPASTPGSVGYNPNWTISNIKNPAIANVVNAALGQVNALPTNPAVNTNVVRTNVKSPAQAARVGAAGSRFDADVNNTRQSFADFTRNFLQATPQVEAATGQETGALGQWYTGEVQGDLDRMSQQRRLATTNAAQRAIGQAIARANSNRLVSGDSTYNTVLQNDAVANIAAQAAREQADLDRSNYLLVRDAQARLAGRRGDLFDNLARRQLLPIQARQDMAGNELAQLGQLGQMDLVNTFYDLDSAEAQMGRRLGLLGQVTNLDQANTFYGLGRQYEPDFAGYQSIPDLPYGGGGGFNFNLPEVYGGVPAAAPNWTSRLRAQPGYGRAMPAPNVLSAPRSELEAYYENGVFPPSMAGRTIVQNGIEYIQGADGSLQMVGSDRLTPMQRYYESGAAIDPAIAGLGAPEPYGPVMPPIPGFAKVY